MSEYIERDAAIREMLFRYWEGKETLREIMQSIPAADVRPVVRCKDCANCEKVDEWEMWCHGRGFPMLMVSADGFCNYGRKK